MFMPDEDDSQQEYEIEETTIEEFLDKIVIEKEEKKVFIVKHDNNSGTGETAPHSIAGKFNWGAFLFNWIWGIKYQKWILLIILVLTIIPYGFIAGIIMCIWAGIKGNQWAWEEVQYKNEEDFHNAQKKWVKAWFITMAILCIAAGSIWYFLPKKQQEEIKLQNYSFFSSTELGIPQKVYDDTTPEDINYEILTSSKYIIYWKNDHNEHSKDNQKYIEEQFAKNKELLADKFTLQPNIINEEEATQDNNIQNNADEPIATNKEDKEVNVCKNKDALCLEAWLNKNCNTGYCIINPTLKKYYKVRGKENVIPKAIRLLKVWE